LAPNLIEGLKHPIIELKKVKDSVSRNQDLHLLQCFYIILSLERPWVIYLQLKNATLFVGIIIAIVVLAAYVIYTQGQGQPTQTTTQTTTTTQTQTTTSTNSLPKNFTVVCSFQSPNTLKMLVSGPARNINVILKDPDGNVTKNTYIAKEKLLNGSTTIDLDLANIGQTPMPGTYTIIVTVQPSDAEVYRTEYLVSITPS
jgi:hypothetical protein